MEQHRVDFNSIPWDSPMEGVRVKIRKQGGRQLRLVEYTKDLKPHWCTKGHIGYVLDGRLEITVDGNTFACAPGDGLLLPAGEEHKHKARMLTDVVRVIFVEDAGALNP